MIVLDASVLISYWTAGDIHADGALAILDTENELLLHPVTLAETLVWPVQRGRGQEALEDIARLGIERHSPLIDEPLRAARLRATTRLRLPDVYVLATALELGATLATFDEKLAAAAREHDVAVQGA
ncbi:PIN domain-containing protein [Microbacterium sp. KR10-403]|uniref:type II toxin-antitoxin system VapC family toxin n=1 Tax=Microbacterium sp. KR10-403 TaxID=3158581 RepID=UPI0032E4C994